jgi:quercetin dioxygenase-like cupin family protein
MKNLLIVSGIAALMMVVGAGVVRAQKAKKVVYVSSSSANFKASPMEGVTMARLWGDPDKGAHATFTKFAPGHEAGMHTHTNDVWISVIKGAYLYKDDAGEKRVGPGDFLRVPGGHPHWSGGDKTEGALFYEESSGKFDLIPAQ